MMEATTTDVTMTRENGQKPVLPFPVRVLLACGWLSAEEAADPAMRVEPLVRSHVVTRVMAPAGRSVVVKHPARERADAGRDLAREMYVYRLTGWIPALAEVMPRPILIDEARQVLVVESLAPAGLDAWPSGTSGAEVDAPGVTARLATLMARWHAATADIALWESHAEGILHLPEELERIVLARSAGGQAFMREIVTDPVCSGILRESLAIYRRTCLVHGDIRCDNWLVARDGPDITLKVIDWETAGVGDPVWDAASVFAEAVLQELRRGSTPVIDENGWPSPVGPVARTFLRSYVEVGGIPPDAERLVLFTASRLIHIACEWAEYELEAETRGAYVIRDLVRAMIERRAVAAGTVARWAAP